MLDLENTGITVGILLPWALELEIWFEPQMTTNGLHTSGFCVAILDFFGTQCTQRIYKRGVPPIGIAFCSPSIFRKSQESALLDGGSRVLVTNVSWGYFNVPISWPYVFPFTLAITQSSVFWRGLPLPDILSSIISLSSELWQRTRPIHFARLSLIVFLFTYTRVFVRDMFSTTYPLQQCLQIYNVSTLAPTSNLSTNVSRPSQALGTISSHKSPLWYHYCRRLHSLVFVSPRAIPSVRSLHCYFILSAHIVT